MWNGRLGKVDNSQVGVFSALCRDQRVTLLDTRLYLPKDWVEDAEPCTPRTHSGRGPANCEANGACAGAGRFGPPTRRPIWPWPLTGATARIPPFSAAWRQRSLCFLADVQQAQRIWLDDPAPYRPATTSRGRLHRSGAPTGRADRGQGSAAPVSAWKRIKLRQGRKAR